MVMLGERVDIDAQLVDRADSIYGDMERPTAREVAEKLIGEVPELIDEWVSAHLAAIVTDFLGKRWRARSSRAGYQVRAGAFADAAEEFMAGDESAISVFLTPMPVDDEGRRINLGEMTGADHRYVARRHRVYAAANKMQAAFHEAIAKAIGDRTTAEVYSEEEYLNMRKQYVKGGDK